MFKPLPLPEGSHADDSKPFSDQDVCNMWCEKAQAIGTRSAFKLVQCPGLRPYLSFGAGPHRGIRNVEGKLFVVSDTHAYWVKSQTEVQQLGEIPGRGRVWISHNQTGSGSVFQVMFSDGPNGWIWDTIDETWTQITDDAFRGARSLIYANTRFLGIENQRRDFRNSDEGDGLAWDGTETYQAESAPDRLVGIIDFAGDIVAFNERTLEFFAPSTSDADIANHIFYVRQGPPKERGAASVHAINRLDNRVFFVGNDGVGYTLGGYESPQRITDHALEAEWQRYDLSKCFSFTYEALGHAIWYVTFPEGRTFGYDCATQRWHRRETIGLKRWRLNTLTKWNGLWIGGSYNSGAMYVLDPDYYLDGCDPLVRRVRTGVLHDNGNRVNANAIRLTLDTGKATSECDTGEDVVPTEPGLPSGFLAVAEDGKTAFSEDGETWDLRTAPTANMLQRVACVNGTWLTASATDSKVYVSTDNGEVWTDYTLTPTCDSFNVLPIAFSPAVGVYIGRDQAHAYLADPDDLTAWTGVTVATGSSNMGGGAGNATRIVLGDYGGKDAWTTDGTFTQVSTAHNSGADIYQVIWDADNSVFVSVAHVTAGSDVCSSADGTASSWTGRHTYAGSSKTARSICPNGQGGYVLMGDADLLLTTPSLGGSWTTRTNPLTGASINDGDIHPDTGRIVIVGDSGKMAYSDDQGATWTAIVSPFSSDKTIFAIRYGVQP